MIVASSERNAHAATFRPKNFAAQVQLLTHQNGIFSLLRSAETLLNMIVSPAVMVVRCNIVAKLRQSCKLITIGQIFFCPSPLPFGGSTVLSLTRGPAGNRTTTGRSTEDQSVQEGFQKLQTRFDFQKTLNKKLKNPWGLPPDTIGSSPPCRNMLKRINSLRPKQINRG